MSVFIGYCTSVARYVAEWCIAQTSCVCALESTKGGVSHLCGRVPSPAERYREKWGIAALVSQHRAQYGPRARGLRND